MPNGRSPETPTQQLRRKQLRDGLGSSPLQGAAQSPSAQLLYELGQQTKGYSQQLQERLDKEAQERVQDLVSQLEYAAAEHDRVRREAQRTQERLVLEIQRERQEQAAEEEIYRDRERQAAVERQIVEQRRKKEELEAQLQREKAAAEELARQEREANEQLRRAQEQAEQAWKDKERAEEARKAESENEQRKLQNAQPALEAKHPPPQSVPQQSVETATRPRDLGSDVAAAPGLVSTVAVREQQHKRYLALHQALKDMRKTVMAKKNSNPAIKGSLGEWRREIVKSVGQLVGGNQNMVQLRKIRGILSEARRIEQPSLNASDYIISEPIPPVDPHDHQVSAVFIYLLNIFSKAVINQFIHEAAVSPKAADPPGITAISIFANADVRWQGISLIDILIAKYHKVCPVVFGINGNDKTEEGRRRLGWIRDSETGAWIGEQRHTERMTGLGSGYGALSLRDFKKSKSVNPFPPEHYWRAMALIINLPPQNVTTTHCTVLRGMIEIHAKNFIMFYGQAAVAALRKAVVELPAQLPQSAASTALATLAPTLRKDLKLTL